MSKSEISAAKHTPDGWYMVGYLNRLGTPFWYVCKDRFAGRDYLMTESGKRRRFLSEKTARAAIAKATGALND